MAPEKTIIFKNMVQAHCYYFTLGYVTYKTTKFEKYMKKDDDIILIWHKGTEHVIAGPIDVVRGLQVN